MFNDLRQQTKSVGRSGVVFRVIILKRGPGSRPLPPPR